MLKLLTNFSIERIIFITAHFVMAELMPLFEQIRQSECDGSHSAALCTIRVGYSVGAVFHKSDSSTSSSMVGGPQADACEGVGYASLDICSCCDVGCCSWSSCSYIINSLVWIIDFSVFYFTAWTEIHCCHICRTHDHHR